MKRAPRSLQHHVLYRKYNGQDSEISALLGKCGVITVAANPEVARYQERHGAIIQRRQVMQWLDAQVPEVDLLETPPARTFLVQEIGAKPVQTMLAL